MVVILFDNVIISLAIILIIAASITSICTDGTGCLNTNDMFTARVTQ